MEGPSRTTIYIKSPLYPLWALWQAKKCKTNPIMTTPDAIGPPLYLTLTEVGDRSTHKPNSQNMRNEPNYRPQPPAPCPKMRNEPNLIPLASPNPRNEPNLRTTNHQLRTKICKTNPISPNPRVIPAKWNPPRRTRGGPPNPRTTNYELYYAKRTQFHKANCQKPTAKKCKTNPIPVRARHAVPPLRETNPITSPLLHYSSSPLLPFSTTPLLHYSPSSRPVPPALIRPAGVNPSAVMDPDSFVVRICPEYPDPAYLLLLFAAS